MGYYVVRRLVLFIPTVILVSVVVFLLVRLIPGNPAYVLLGPNATQAQVIQVTHSLALDQPLWTQYIVWVAHILHGNFGDSYINDFPVTRLILQKLPATIELAVGAIIISLVVSFPLGILSALHNRHWIDHVASLYNALAMGMPVFWLGILLVLVFSFQLHLAPPSGYTPVTASPVQGLRFLTLPAITLGVSLSGILSRFIRSSILAVLSQDYVRTARAKGLSQRAVIGRHVLKNALIPIITIVGLQFGGILGGVVIVETVFQWPGLGSLLVTSILTRDYTVVQAVILLAVVTYMVVNLVTDIVYTYVNPRVQMA
jgi:peptide/nickel transport system permease protein